MGGLRMKILKYTMIVLFCSALFCIPIYFFTDIVVFGLVGYISLMLEHILIIYNAFTKKQKGQGTVLREP